MSKLGTLLGYLRWSGFMGILVFGISAAFVYFLPTNPLSQTVASSGNTILIDAAEIFYFICYGVPILLSTLLFAVLPIPLNSVNVLTVTLGTSLVTYLIGYFVGNKVRGKRSWLW